MAILTKDLVERAIQLATPTALGILNTPGATWGPKWVNGLVLAPGIESEIPFTIGEEKEWDLEWGERKDFQEVAGKKMDVVEREGASTSLIVAMKPWLLEDGEFLYVGGAHEDGISVTASGAKGWADEGISNVIIDMMKMLAHLETDYRIQMKLMQI